MSFPTGSESPLRRAKPNVWTDKVNFGELAKKNEQAAMAFAAFGKAGGELKVPSGALFQTCKACQDEFPVSKKGE